MTIERDGYNGPIVFRCDGDRCHEYEEARCEDFGGAITKARSHGWTARKVGGEWEHLCPDCEG